MTRLLVTGFGPFPGVRVNPSAALARLLAADRRLARSGVSTTMRLIPTTWAEVEALVPALAALKPDAVLMLGVAGRRRGLSLEMRARNRRTFYPDADGRRAAGMLIAPGQGAERRARAPVIRLVHAGRGFGPRVRASRDAGAYLCNDAYWRMLEALPAATPCLFVHVPKLRGPRLGRAAEALERIALGLVSAARRRPAAA